MLTSKRVLWLAEIAVQLDHDGEKDGLRWYVLCYPCRRDVEVHQVLAAHPPPSPIIACACLVDVHWCRYTICGIPLEQDWKAEAQTVIATAAGLWFTVARLGDTLQPIEASHKSQAGKPGAGGTVLRKAQKVLGKTKVH